MKNKFAVFILSHERPHCPTFETLLKAGYKDAIYIVCDNEDKELDSYKEKYKDKLLIFNKKDYIKQTDTCDNKQITSCAVFARNACIDFAKQLNYDYFAEFDDDITHFRYRYIDNNQLKAKAVTSNFSQICDAVIELLKQKGISSLSLGSARCYIGGIGNYNKRLFYNVNQCIFLKSKTKYFKGAFDEDANYEFETLDSGVSYSFVDIQQESPDRGTNGGGTQSAYKEIDSFKRCVYAYIVNPSGISINQNQKTGLWLLRKTSEHLYPKIISSNYKK